MEDISLMVLMKSGPSRLWYARSSVRRRGAVWNSMPPTGEAGRESTVGRGKRPWANDPNGSLCAGVR